MPTPNDEKLAIALDALLVVSNLESDDENFVYRAHRIAQQALQAIRRDHYLDTPSQAVRDKLTGVWV